MLQFSSSSQHDDGDAQGCDAASLGRIVGARVLRAAQDGLGRGFAERCPKSLVPSEQGQVAKQGTEDPFGQDRITAFLLDQADKLDLLPDAAPRFHH